MYFIINSDNKIVQKEQDVKNFDSSLRVIPNEKNESISILEKKIKKIEVTFSEECLFMCYLTYVNSQPVVILSTA